jgi:hypothetical protein
MTSWRPPFLALAAAGQDLLTVRALDPDRQREALRALAPEIWRVSLQTMHSHAGLDDPARLKMVLGLRNLWTDSVFEHLHGGLKPLSRRALQELQCLQEAPRPSPRSGQTSLCPSWDPRLMCGRAPSARLVRARAQALGHAAAAVGDPRKAPYDLLDACVAPALAVAEAWLWSGDGVRALLGGEQQLAQIMAQLRLCPGCERPTLWAPDAGLRAIRQRLIDQVEGA